MKLLELLPLELHGLGDYLLLGLLGAVAVALLWTSTRGARRLLAVTAMGASFALAAWWTALRHDWTAEQIAASEAKLAGLREDVSRRDRAIAEHQAQVRELEAKIDRVQGRIGETEAAGDAAERDLELRLKAREAGAARGTP